MVADLQEAQLCELQDVRGELGHLTTRVDSSEVISAAVEARLRRMERAQADAEAQLTEGGAPSGRPRRYGEKEQSSDGSEGYRR